MGKAIICLIFFIGMIGYIKIIKYDQLHSNKICLSISILIANVSLGLYIADANNKVIFVLNLIAITFLLYARFDLTHFKLWYEWQKTTEEDLKQKLIVLFKLRYSEDFMKFLWNKAFNKY